MQKTTDQQQRPVDQSNTRRPPGASEIVLPISSDEYQEVIDNPVGFRSMLDEQFNANPQCFPINFAEGFQFKDSSVSSKMDMRIRRITVGSGDDVRFFRVVPCDILPHMCGKTEEVADALLLRKCNVPYWMLSKIFGRCESFYYRVECRLGRSSIVGAVQGRNGELPEDLCCDEKHASHLGEKAYITTTVGGGCVLGAHLCEGADAQSLAEGYQVARDEMAQANPDHCVGSINVDGFTATTAALRLVYGPVIMITCILHLYISLRDGAKKKYPEKFREIADLLWWTYAATSLRSFAQRWVSFMRWAEDNQDEIPERLLSKLRNAYKNKLAGYKAYYARPSGYRVSSTIDRMMGSLDRRLFAMRHLHGYRASSNLLIRAWAHLHNFTPWNPQAVRKHNAQCPAERLTGFRYRDNWLENFRVASSLQGYRFP